MTHQDVLNLLRGGEGDRTEFKRGLGDGKAVLKALCAFANTEGGVLLLGVDDAGAVVGVKEDPEGIHERLTSFLQTGLNAPLQARLGRHEDPAGWIHTIEVPRQRGFEPMRHDGRVFVRRGRASVEPSSAELQDLYNLFGYILTEERAIEAAGERDIDSVGFRAFLEGQGLEVHESPQPEFTDDLRNRGVLTEIGGALRATLYGLLAFGKNPQSFSQTRSFWVECVIYAGLDRSAEVLSVAEARGRIDEQVERALDWMKLLGRGERYEGILREDLPRVPERVIREALVNAVAHRDYAILGSRILLEVYDDRIEVTSPGTLPNHMTPTAAMAGGHPRSRNELLVNFFQVKRMMESRGWDPLESTCRHASLSIL